MTLNYNTRLLTADAIGRSSIHRSLASPSSAAAMLRLKNSVSSDPGIALDLIRQILQKEINDKVKVIFDEYVKDYFEPALKNAKTNNVGDEILSGLLEKVCVSALEHAKTVFSSPKGVAAKRKSSEVDKSLQMQNKIKKLDKGNYVPKIGKRVKKDGPMWDSKRLKSDTLFILGSKANKALGYGQTRGRLYMKHPELFKYAGDQQDKEWLAKSQIMSTTGGKAYLMVLSDITNLSKSPEYASHPNQQPSELVGFTVPTFILDKMKYFMEQSRNEDNSNLECTQNPGELIVEIKEEDEGRSNQADDELEFLQGMNLNSLVRELELETVGNGRPTLDILTLTDDAPGGFLTTGVQESIGNLDSIRFD